MKARADWRHFGQCTMSENGVLVGPYIHGPVAKQYLRWDANPLGDSHCKEMSTTNPNPIKYSRMFDIQT